MTETERWIEQTRQYLKTAHRADSKTLAAHLKDRLERVDLEQIQADLGCGDDCIQCSWGTLGGQPLGSEPCRLLVLQQRIDSLRERPSRGTAARQEAASLLEILDSLPSLNR